MASRRLDERDSASLRGKIPALFTRVWDFPAGSDRLVADRPEGILRVLVNGAVIREDGRSVEAAALDGYPGEPIASATT